MLQLLNEIHSQPDNKTLIFTGTKRMANEISGTLRRQGWKAGAIHGDKKQEEREYVLNRECYVVCLNHVRNDVIFGIASDVEIQNHVMFAVVPFLDCFFNFILISEFRDSHMSILIATDVAARGLGKPISCNLIHCVLDNVSGWFPSFVQHSASIPVYRQNPLEVIPFYWSVRGL